MSIQGSTLIDWPAHARARQELGTAFVRILGYFREDGIKSIAALEAAMRTLDPAAMVIPAHTLKAEARQFGAEPLAALAEHVEMTARDCVELHQRPVSLGEQVAALRPLFGETLAALERDANPLVMRQPAGGFGRKVG